MQIVEPGHSFVDVMPNQLGSSARRIRIGLTGLALAFLLVLIGSVINRSSRDEEANAVATPAASTKPPSPEEPSEPLAELGVAPGAADALANNTVDK
ncbi:MAG: hypothetical protein ABIR63_03495 [Sphingomicrobium sp.]